jgi:hypothetical protein
MEIARTILNQLGGNKFLVMTGAKNLMALDNGLKMTLPKNMSKANRLEIKVNGMDLYDIRFYHFTEPKVDFKTMEYHEAKTKEIQSFKDIYCDQLQEIFESATGMYTKLF